MSISMYFGVSWLDPRIQINRTASEWTEVKTGPKDVSRIFTKIISNSWFTWKLNKYCTVFTTNLFAMINDQSPFAGSKCFPTESKIYLVSWAGDIWTGAFWETKSSERNVRSSHTKEQKYSLWAWVCKDLSYSDVMYKLLYRFLPHSVSLKRKWQIEYDCSIVIKLISFSYAFYFLFTFIPTSMMDNM